MDQDTDLILQRIRELPAHSLTTKMRSPRGTFERNFKGALLYQYAEAYDLVPEPMPATGPSNSYYIATADDGFKVALSFAEVSPRWTDKQVLLAYEQDGEPIRVGVRLVVPDDDLGGRSIFGITGIELRSIDFSLDSARPASNAVELKGLVDRHQTLDLAALNALPQTEASTPAYRSHGGVMQPARRFRGPNLFQVLGAAGLRLNPEINEDILRKVVVARSTDGYAVAIAAGEIEPRFMNGGAIIATTCEDAPIEDGGSLRLVLPYDKAVGRAVKSLASIELIEA